MKYHCLLLFGPPGSGKGTQGKILGTIPGFCHVACGDVFRSLDMRTEVALTFIEYSKRGELVPDEITVQMWRDHIKKVIALGRFKPEIDHLILDGIPRNIKQAEMLENDLDVRKVFHLKESNRDELVERLRRRALKENRLDDTNNDVILNRLEAYEKESKPVLKFYKNKGVVEIDGSQFPYQVLRDILKNIDTTTYKPD